MAGNMSHCNINSYSQTKRNSFINERSYNDYCTGLAIDGRIILNMVVMKWHGMWI